MSNSDGSNISTIGLTLFSPAMMLDSGSKVFSEMELVKQLLFTTVLNLERLSLIGRVC